MSDPRDTDERLDIRSTDERLGELLRREAPVPEHGEGYRERVAALLSAESAARAQRRRWWPAEGWWAGKPSEVTPAVVRKAAPRRVRSPRPALVVTLALLLLLVAFIGSLEPLQRLLSPTLVLRITDETVVDAEDPAGTRTTVVATTLVSLDETRRVIDGLLEAINANDTPAVGKFYATNGWLQDRASEEGLQGSVGIADYWRDAHDRLGLRVEAVGDPLPYDRYVSQPVRYLLPDDGEAPTGVLVFQIDATGHIARQWITGWVAE